MPEVKPKYVDPKQLLDRPVEGRLVLSGNDTVPVLTLDQIEAWLKNDELVYESHPLHWWSGRKSLRNELLAQVQAWKEGK